jgi:hypothetical protein
LVYEALASLKNARNVCRPVKPVNTGDSFLVCSGYGNALPVEEFVAANIVLAIAPLVGNRELYWIIRVGPGVILETIRAGSCATAIEGEDCAVLHLNDAHGLIGFRQTSRGYAGKLPIHFGGAGKLWLRGPVTLRLRGTSISIIAAAAPSSRGNLYRDRRGSFGDRSCSQRPSSLYHHFSSTPSKEEQAAHNNYNSKNQYDKSRSYTKHASRTFQSACRHSITRRA